MKPIITVQRGADSQRQCVPLRDMTDCLLQAYDCVARRAYQKFLRRGGVPGGELDDWLNAEHELLGNLPVDVEDSGAFVSALASLPGLTSEDVDVGIDPRWLVVLGRQAAAGLNDEPLVDDEQIAAWASSIHTDAGTLQTRVRQARRKVPPITRELAVACSKRGGENPGEISVSTIPERDFMSDDSSMRSASLEGEAVVDMWPAEGLGGEMESVHEIDTAAEKCTAPSQLFCILELPAEVDPQQSVAVLANGLLGIRMPKKARSK
jgi:HSP20 family molecular chaperone IbpA